MPTKKGKWLVYALILVQVIIFGGVFVVLFIDSLQNGFLGPRGLVDILLEGVATIDLVVVGVLAIWVQKHDRRHLLKPAANEQSTRVTSSSTPPATSFDVASSGLAYCRTCGRKVRTGARLCEHCGAEL